MTDCVVTSSHESERSVESEGVLRRSGVESRMIVWTGFDGGSVGTEFDAGAALERSGIVATGCSITSAIERKLFSCIYKMPVGNLQAVFLLVF